MLRSSLSWPRPAKVLTVIVVDAAISVLATWCAFSLRLDTPYVPTRLAYAVFLLAMVTQLAAFLQFRLYRVVFRYVSLQTMLTMAKATALHGAVLFAALLLLRLPEIPRSLGLIQPVIVLVFIAASRALAGAVLRDEALHELIDPGNRARLLIYGAGQEGVQTAAAIAHSPNFRLVGFIDEDPHKAGRTIHGHRVILPSEIAELVELQKVTDILLALPGGVTRAQRNEIIESLRSFPVHVRTVPAMSDVASGRVSVQDIQELDLEDLLGRDAVAPDPELLSMNLAGKVVLVTGAGGSIGGELCRQIVCLGPVRLLLVEHNEYGLYAIHDELQAFCRNRGLDVELVPLLGSVRNLRRINDIFRHYRPETVYHAAAYKHVPLVEQNAAEGVDNNIFGTLKVAAAAITWGVSRFVLISTDKAVRPTNVMGASKRVAELILQALAAQQTADFTGLLPVHSRPLPIRTCFAMVRFGNVLDSSGSVVPLFRRQIALGGPLTVTHREVTRYFMTIPEAAQLVLQAGAMAVGGDVFVLDMGTPVRIFDLAQRMIALSGLTVRDEEHPFGDIEIQISGLRPGEKLYEELLIGDNPQQTSHPRIMKAREELVEWPELVRQLQTMRRAAECNDVGTIKAVLSSLVSGYAGSNEIVDHLGPSPAPEEPAAVAHV